MPNARRPVLWVALAISITFSGCSRPATGTTDPEPKLRLERLLGSYKAFVVKNKKGPANEAALRTFLLALSQEEKNNLKIGDDLDALFVSPRDQQKYEVRYGLPLTVGGATEAVAWEKTGQDGHRYVALNIGYVQQYSEQDFQELKKK